MTTTPLVSIVMAVYNGEEFLVRAMEGILAQTFTSFELIIIDDASTDNTAQILTQFTDPRLRVITNETNLGAYGAANVGLELARGAFIARHDADDISLPQRLQRQVERMQAEPALVLLGTSYHVIDENEHILETSLLPQDNSALQKRLQHGNIFLHGTFMMRREALERVGYYRDYFPVSQDYDLSLRLAEIGEVAILPDPLYLFRFHRSSLSRTKKELQLACRQLAWALAEDRRLRGVERPIPENVVEAFPPEPERLIRDALGNTYLYYVAGDHELAAQALARVDEYTMGLSKDFVDWWEWLLSSAHKLAEKHNSIQTGATFISWLFSQIDKQTIPWSENQVLGNYYADRAFVASRFRQRIPVVRCFLRAITHDRRWLLNRGLWVISGKALLAP